MKKVHHKSVNGNTEIPCDIILQFNFQSFTLPLPVRYVVLDGPVHVALHVQPGASVPLGWLSTVGSCLPLQLLVPDLSVWSVRLQRTNWLVGLQLIAQLGQSANDLLVVFFRFLQCKQYKLYNCSYNATKSPSSSSTTEEIKTALNEKPTKSTEGKCTKRSFKFKVGVEYEGWIIRGRILCLPRHILKLSSPFCDTSCQQFAQL